MAKKDIKFYSEPKVKMLDHIKELIKYECTSKCLFLPFPKAMWKYGRQAAKNTCWSRLVCLTELTLTMRSYIIEKHNDTFYCVTLKPLEKV